MSASLITGEELLAELGLKPGVDGAPSHAALARALRLAAARWSPTRRVALFGWLKELTELAGLSWAELVRPRAEETLDQLLALGELELHSMGEPAGSDDDAEDTPEVARPRPRGATLIAAPLRGVSFGPLTLLCGCADMNDEVLDAASLPLGPGLAGVARWLRRDAANPLSVGQVTADDWLGFPAHRRVLDRLEGYDDAARAERAPDRSLGALWPLLGRLVRAHGLVVEDPGAIQALAGRPGEPVGRPGAGGRWRPVASVPAEVYCGARPAPAQRTDERWQPVVVERCLDGSARLLDLYDWDEHCWAQLSRAVALGAPERVRVKESGQLSAAVSLPSQLQRLMALGERRGWSSTPPAEALPTILRLLQERGGLAQG